MRCVFSVETYSLLLDVFRGAHGCVRHKHTSLEALMNDSWFCLFRLLEICDCLDVSVLCA